MILNYLLSQTQMACSEKEIRETTHWNVDSKLKCNFSASVEDFAGCSIAESLTWSVVDLFQSVTNISHRHITEV